MMSSMTNFGGFCDLHPGITTRLSASSVASHSRTSRASHSRTSHASPSRISHASSLRQINLYNRHSNILSKIIDLSCHDSLLIGECSNMNISFSVSFSTEPLLLSTTNILRADEIADLLKIYSNQHFIDILISIALYNAHVDLQSNSSNYIRHSNHFSAFAHPDIPSLSTFFLIFLMKSRMMKKSMSK